MLISLWMAQGYINEEYEGEKYFHILLQRCFFQEVKEYDINDIISFKIHDVLHDFAEHVANKEVCRLLSYPFKLDIKVRHLCLLYGFYSQGIFKKTQIRTCLQIMYSWNLTKSSQLLASILIANCSSLRSLDLNYLLDERLPESISELFHLRYLSLADSKNLKVLPNSITKLVNLQTLDLTRCGSLEELPKDICKLVDLSTLNITSCNNVSHMPPNLNLLTKLHTLGRFVVGGTCSFGQQCFSGLEGLHDLDNLKGSLDICIDVRGNASYVKEDYGGGDYLIGKIHLHTISIDFTNKSGENIEWEQRLLLEEMQPHENIKKLFLSNYNGEKMARWAMKEDYFPNLVHLSIVDCGRLRFLPSLEKLPHLKDLTLSGSPSVEYIINVNLEECSLSEGSSLFPCLKSFNLNELPNLKGWWPSGYGEQNEQLIGEEEIPCFGQLKILRITGCPMLKSIPVCSNLEYACFDDDAGRRCEMNADKLPMKYKWLLPAERKSRIVHLSYLLDNFPLYIFRS